MSRRIALEEVARFLELDRDLLRELRSEGLFRHEEVSPEEAEELRVAVVWMRDLGVNTAGVDVALQLRRRLLCLEDRLRRVLREMEPQR